jgi:photosystem II stability/assembly factor-like uncharacterized protein
MTFVDAAHGFVLLQGCTESTCESWVDVTGDGGERWKAQPALVAYLAADNLKTALPDGPVPNPNKLGAASLVFTSANDGWAYGPGLFVTHDGGREFRRLNVSAPVLSVVASEGRVWVLERRCLPANRNRDGGYSNMCDRPMLLSGPVGGDSLSPVVGQIRGFPLASGAMPGSQFPTEIVHASSKVAVLAGPYGLDVTNNGGRTWLRASYPCKGMYGGNVVSSGWGTGSVAMDPTGSIWLICAGEPGAGQQPKQLWRSPNNAQTWFGPYPLSWSGYADTVYAISSTTAWNYGSRAPVLRTTDGGRTWRPLLESVFNDAEGGPAAFSAIGTQDAWAIPSNQVPTEVLRTTNAGRSWQSVKASTVATSPPNACPTGVFPPGELFGVQFLSVTTGWTVGSNGVLATDDGGVRWTVQYRARCADLTEVEFVDAEHGWAVGLTDLLVTTDGGRHWQQLQEPAWPVRSAHFVSPRVGYAVAGGATPGNWSPMTPWTGGVVLKTLDGGQSWTRLAAPADAQSLCFATSDDGWLGADGRIYRSLDGGRSWSLALKGYGQGEDRSLAMVQCAGQKAGWAELDGPGGEMSQSPHVAFHSDGGPWTPIFAEQYFPHPGVAVSVNSPGSYSGPFSTIDPDTAVFIDSCDACGYRGTAPWAFAERGGKQLVRRGNVGYITSAIGVSFVTSRSGWVTGIYWGGSSTVYRLVHTNNAGRTWTVEYTS